MTTAPEPCVACGGSRRSTLLNSNGTWGVDDCGVCGLHRLWMERPGPTAGDEYAGIDPARYRRALAELRRKSANRLLDLLEERTAGRRLLDVGCGFGWFLDAATRRGWRATGIDPSPRAAVDGTAQGLDVRRGEFPRSSPEGETFDVIAFLDVLEHLPDPRATLAAAARRLNAGGVVAIKLPNQAGPLYRIALALTRAAGGRLRAPLERLYQLAFPYPHLYYYGVLSLTTLLRRNGFEVVGLYEEEILDRRGIFERLSYTETRAWRKALQGPAALALMVLGPLLRVWPRRDILTVLARPARAGAFPPIAFPPAPALVVVPSPVLRDMSDGNEKIPSLYYHSNRWLRSFFWARLGFLRELILSHGGDRGACLDFGGGSGVFLPTLSLCFGSVTCLDLFVSEAQRLTETFGLSNARVIRGDVLTSTPTSSFDCVVAADVLEHFQDTVPVARVLHGALKEGGVLFTSLPTENWVYRILRRVFGMEKPKDHYHTGADVERWLEQNGFVRLRTLFLPFRINCLPLFIVTAWGKGKTAAGEKPT